VSKLSRAAMLCYCQMLCRLELSGTERDGQSNSTVCTASTCISCKECLLSIHHGVVRSLAAPGDILLL
jgi:hypothetical protein